MLNKSFRYYKFLLNGVSKYKVHSPFVYEFIEKVLEDKEVYYCYLAIEHVRRKLAKQKQTIILNDLGQGNNSNVRQTTTINRLLNNVQSSTQKAQLLFRIANYYQCSTILEIGTSLGFTTAYLANSNKKAKVVTIEGDPEISSIAQNIFNQLGLKNVTLLNSPFDSILNDVLTDSFQLIFFDGNHSKEATLRYFNWAKNHINDETIFVFDDIYWSESMKEAWCVIIEDSSVCLSIDLFSIGIVFFNPNREKQQFKLVHSSNFY